MVQLSLIFLYVNIHCFLFQNFVTDFTSISQECNFEDEEKRLLLNEVISEHFMRQGMLHIADALIEVQCISYMNTCIVLSYTLSIGWIFCVGMSCQQIVMLIRLKSYNRFYSRSDVCSSIKMSKYNSYHYNGEKNELYKSFVPHIDIERGFFFLKNCEYLKKRKAFFGYNKKFIKTEWGWKILILCLLNVLLTKEEIIIKPKMLFFPNFF